VSASLPEAMDIETTQQIEEDLSITLLERRKRLHVLATEINNWEDQETKKYERKRIRIFQFHDLKNVCYFVISLQPKLLGNNINTTTKSKRALHIDSLV